MNPWRAGARQLAGDVDSASGGPGWASEPPSGADAGPGTTL